MARSSPQEKRSALIHSTMRMFNRYGVGVTMAKITEEAGVALGTPFLYFSGKDELLRETFLYTHRHAASCIGEGVDWAKPVREVVCQLVRNVLLWAMNNPEEQEFTEKYIDAFFYDFYSPTFRDYQAEVLGDPRIADRLAEYVRKDCPMQLLQRVVSVQQTAYARYLISHRDEVDVEEFCAMAADMIWNAIRA